MMRLRVPYLLALGATVVGLVVPTAASAQTTGSDSRFRAAGEITAVNAAASSFDLHTLRGESLTISTDDNTQFRSADGSVQSVADLEPGMKAFAIGTIASDGTHLARQVGAGTPQSIRRRLVRKVGEITSVVPGQSTFTLQPAQGDPVEFHVTDRTHYASRDQSVTDIHDLKKGMQARVAALVQDDGSLEAILVAVASADASRPGQNVDVRKAGRIVELGVQSLVLQTRDGQQLTVAVDDQTIYRSPQGKIQGFSDLETGMLAAVGARDDAGQLTAVWIAAGRLRPFLGGANDGAGSADGAGVPTAPSFPAFGG